MMEKLFFAKPNSRDELQTNPPHAANWDRCHKNTSGQDSRWVGERSCISDIRHGSSRCDHHAEGGYQEDVGYSARSHSSLSTSGPSIPIFVASVQNYYMGNDNSLSIKLVAVAVR
jgi:hypothetical protein